MEKNRLESFSDGVFAFAVTLLIVNIRIPDTKDFNNHQLIVFLLSIIPSVTTFIFTFLVVGIFWVAHQRMFRFVKVIDSTLTWINVVYLLFIVMVPLPTAILSSNPFLPTAIFFYCSVLLILASMHVLIVTYVFNKADLKQEIFTVQIYRSTRKIALFGTVCYVLAGISGFINVYISFFFIIAVIVYYIFIPKQSAIESKIIKSSKTQRK